MSEVDPKIIAELDQEKHGMKSKQLANGMVVWSGPWLKEKNGQPKFFDNYTEALYANINHKRNETLRAAGLNEHGQTPEQEKAFKAKQAEQFKKKKAAEVAVEMVAQTK